MRSTPGTAVLVEQFAFGGERGAARRAREQARTQLSLQLLHAAADRRAAHAQAVGRAREAAFGGDRDEGHDALHSWRKDSTVSESWWSDESAGNALLDMTPSSRCCDLLTLPEAMSGRQPRTGQSSSPGSGVWVCRRIDAPAVMPGIERERSGSEQGDGQASTDMSGEEQLLDRTGRGQCGNHRHAQDQGHPSGSQADGQEQGDQSRGRIQNAGAYRDIGQQGCDAEGHRRITGADDQQAEPGTAIGIAAYIIGHSQTISPDGSGAMPRSGGFGSPVSGARADVRIA